MERDGVQEAGGTGGKGRVRLGRKGLGCLEYYGEVVADGNREA